MSPVRIGKRCVCKRIIVCVRNAWEIACACYFPGVFLMTAGRTAVFGLLFYLENPCNFSGGGIMKREVQPKTIANRQQQS